MKRLLTSLTALVFAGAMTLPVFAQTETPSPPDNPSSTSASSSASTSETRNGVTTTHQNNAQQKSGTNANGNYSEHSTEQFENKESPSTEPGTGGDTSAAPNNPGAGNGSVDQ